MLPDESIGFCDNLLCPIPTYLVYLIVNGKDEPSLHLIHLPGNITVSEFLLGYMQAIFSPDFENLEVKIGTDAP